MDRPKPAAVIPQFLPPLDPNEEKVPAHILVSSQWTPAEDEILKAKIKEYGTQNWVIIAKYLPGRLGRQCRERWHNVLDPSIVRREWTREEDLFILDQHKELGSKWSQISKMEPVLGRTVSQIKNRYYQNLKGKDISKIKYKADEESAGVTPGESKTDECNL